MLIQKYVVTGIPLDEESPEFKVSKNHNYKPP